MPTHPSTHHAPSSLQGHLGHSLRKSDFHYTPPDRHEITAKQHIRKRGVDGLARILLVTRIALDADGQAAGLILRPFAAAFSTAPPRDRRLFKTPHGRRDLAPSILVAVVLAIALPLLASTPATSATPPTADRPTWRWPLDGTPRILRRFTPPPEPWLAGHRGIDLAAPASTPVLAAGKGTIGYAGSVAGRGVVTVNHPDGLRTTYLPVTAAVRQGDPVAPGDPLGTIEPGPTHCPESCLHWGLRRATTTYLDPLLLLGLARIRLLPHWQPDTTLPRIGSSPSSVPSAIPLSPHRGGRSTRKQPVDHPSGPTRPDRHATPAPTAADRFQLRSASTPMAATFGLAALLAAFLLLTLLRHRLRKRRSRPSPTGGRHSARSNRTPSAGDRCPPQGQHRKPRRGRARRQQRRRPAQLPR
ncbi:peptidoglycan DD-metalloendopeptidase family protein [Nonomuraea sp. LPB2021202275-12-8]|uniref:murein hydrolase activator EnvC family protein n=1 Tax=Nonomuraea sp. LPB2021202275-12-8 TaxID=3120159 RepID=UPI003FA5579D